MGQGKKKTYSKEIEAAWYVLIRFMSTCDYVIRYIDKHGEKQTITPNSNCVLASQMSKNGLLKPQRITKSMLLDHFDRTVIIFYKSPPNSKLTTGYGRCDKSALDLSFSAELNITTKKKTDPQYYVLLIGIDIDCHNGERHVREVEELIKQYLPNTYWEVSTNGKGRHGYLKIKFLKSFGVIDVITDCLNKLFARLNELKTLYGYEAKIDDPAGLPYKLKLVDNNPYEKEWTTLIHKTSKEEKFLGKNVNPKSEIWKDYVSYLRNNTIHHVPEECYSRPSKLSEYLSLNDIRTTYSRFISDNYISFPAPSNNRKYYEITYQRALKLPLFGAVTSDYNNALPNMDCIREFHSLPYYTSSELFTVYQQIQEDIHVLKNSPPSLLHSSGSYHLSSGSLEPDPIVDIISTSSDSDEDILSMPIPIKGGGSPSTHSCCSPLTGNSIQNTLKNKIVTEIGNSFPIKKVEKTIGNNCACTHTPNMFNISTEIMSEITENETSYAEVVAWSDVAMLDHEDFEIGKFWNNYKQGKSIGKSNTYKEKLELARSEDNTMKRTSLFVRAYINTLGRMPTDDEVETEYVAQGLNRNSQSSTHNRRNRLKGCIDYYSKGYDESKTGFMLNWSEEKAEVLNLMKSYFPEKLTFKQGKATRTINPEDIGFVYYVIAMMGNSDQHDILKNSLSYKQADELFLSVFGQICGRHKFSAIIKILRNRGLIEKVRNYKTGLRGNCYVATIKLECGNRPD